MALKRALRLRKSSDFQRVRQQGRVASSPLLVLAYLPSNTPGIRIGFVVSKRISKSAVKRNYVKRLLSEAIRPFLPELLGNWDVVLSVKQQVVDSDLAVLTQDVGRLLRRAQLRDALSKQSN
ncbi:MAG: ribonuclease P protein component [Ktedonobacteraceae bacterium]|nr:ribonuclease P protein component [Ktedonobacteraceae bacterium]